MCGLCTYIHGYAGVWARTDAGYTLLFYRVSRSIRDAFCFRFAKCWNRIFRRRKMFSFFFCICSLTLSELERISELRNVENFIDCIAKRSNGEFEFKARFLTICKTEFSILNKLLFTFFSFVCI